MKKKESLPCYWVQLCWAYLSMPGISKMILFYRE